MLQESCTTLHRHLDPLLGISAGVGDGTGTKACFVGENTTGNALLHTGEEGLIQSSSKRLAYISPKLDNYQNDLNL